MASEFTRKVQKIKDILKFNSVLADDGDVLLTKDGEVYTQVNGKVKQLSNPNYGKDNANKILSVSDTGDAVPIPMPNSGNILDKDNTFTGNNKFTSLIDGYVKTKLPTINDLNLIVKSGKYELTTAPNYSNIPLRMPNNTILIVENTQDVGITSDLVYQIILSRDPKNTYGDSTMFIRMRFLSTWSEWRQLARDNEVFHNFGNETSSGDKTFNGQTTLLNGNFGLRVTNSGIVKTTDAGKTWVAL